MPERFERHAVQLTIRACLEDDPGWHDVAAFVSIGATGPSDERASAGLGRRELFSRHGAKLCLDQVLAKRQILRARLR